MTTQTRTRVLDAGGPLFLHNEPPDDTMPACGRGVCVEMPIELAKPGDSIGLTLRRMQRHNGGPADVELERFDVSVSLATGDCSPRNDAAHGLLAEQPWIPAALVSQLDELRRRARRLFAQRDRTFFHFALGRTETGKMVAYDELFPHDWDLLFAHDGHPYWASDQHCPNPACHCRDITVVLYDLETPDARAVGELRIHLGSRKPRANPSSPAAAHLFEPLWNKHGPELTRRHHEVRRALADHADSHDHRARPPAPGRNAPCPCGSGKKFKRCCALRESVLQPVATGARR